MRSLGHEHVYALCVHKLLPRHSPAPAPALPVAFPQQPCQEEQKLTLPSLASIIIHLH